LTSSCVFCAAPNNTQMSITGGIPRYQAGPLIMGGKVVYDIPEKVPFLSEPKIRVFGPFCPNSDHEVPRGGVFVRTLLISCKKIAKNLKKLPNDSAVAYSI
jgi:hypothetical protein